MGNSNHHHVKVYDKEENMHLKNGASFTAPESHFKKGLKISCETCPKCLGLRYGSKKKEGFGGYESSILFITIVLIILYVLYRFRHRIFNRF